MRVKVARVCFCWLPRLSGCTAWRRLRPSRRPGRDLSDLPARQRRSRVRIIVFGQDNLSRLYSVDTAGRIAFPLIGTDEARGLSTTQLGSEIEGELRKNYIKDPKVSVEADAYRPFFILGEVKAGAISLRQRKSAVAVAEGYTERAKQRMVRLTRKFGGMMSTSWCRPIILSGRASLFTSSKASSKAH
jgi:protein involved in polysaccharide export with SLBB domain